MVRREVAGSSSTRVDVGTAIAGMKATTVVPVHCEGWSHFSEPVEHARRVLEAPERPLPDFVRWPRPGEPLALTA